MCRMHNRLNVKIPAEIVAEHIRNQAAGTQQLSVVNVGNQPVCSAGVQLSTEECVGGVVKSGGGKYRRFSKGCLSKKNPPAQKLVLAVPEIFPAALSDCRGAQNVS